MKRNDFIQIIKLRSCWKIDKRKGNYTLPNNERLSVYVEKLVRSQMGLDGLGICHNGDLVFCSGGEWDVKKKLFNDYTIMPAFQDNETCAYDEMEKRIRSLVLEIIS